MFLEHIDSAFLKQEKSEISQVSLEISLKILVKTQIT